MVENVLWFDPVATNTCIYSTVSSKTVLIHDRYGTIAAAQIGTIFVIKEITITISLKTMLFIKKMSYFIGTVGFPILRSKAAAILCACVTLKAQFINFLHTILFTAFNNLKACSTRTPSVTCLQKIFTNIRYWFAYLSVQYNLLTIFNLHDNFPWLQ